MTPAGAAAADATPASASPTGQTPAAATPAGAAPVSAAAAHAGGAGTGSGAPSARRPQPSSAGARRGGLAAPRVEGLGPRRPDHVQYSAPSETGEATLRADGSPTDFSKVGRNELCPCGSGKKFKRCHGDPRMT